MGTSEMHRERTVSSPAPVNRLTVAATEFPNCLLGPALITLALALSTTSQSKPELRITEPSEGAILNPGQTVTVRVTSATPELFPGVLVGGDATPFAGTVSQLPGELPVQIPKDIHRLGKHWISVMGTPKSGKEPVGDEVAVDVERPDLPASMSASLSGLEFDFPGEQSHLDVQAEFPDRSADSVIPATYDVTESSHISFSSANPEVATVDSSGLVTAVAPGIGEIRVKYAVGDVRLSIGIPVDMRNPDEEANANRFSFSIAPGLQRIEPGNSTTFEVTVSSLSKFPGEIEFSAHGLPEGATASFTPVSVHAPESAILTISTLRSTPLDTYPIFISARSGKLNPTASLLLVLVRSDEK